MKILKLIDYIKNEPLIQAALITASQNIFYFTKLKVHDTILFITQSEAFLFVDSRYIEYAKSSANNCNIILINNIKKQLNDIILHNKIKHVSTDISYTTIKNFDKYINYLEPAVLLNNSILDDEILHMRSIKSSDELYNIRASQKLVDKGYNYILNFIKPGICEFEFATELEFYLRKNGATKVSFDIIALFGNNTSKPHGEPGNRLLQNGDLILLDFGAIFNDYCSDMTRTFALGNITQHQEFVYNVVLNAQKIAIDAILPGAICCEIDEIARNYINANGFEGKFKHGLGHSLGINIHEEPAFNLKCNTIIKENMVFTVEPGVYLENNFGIRIEDTVFVTKNGCENITDSYKEKLLII